SGRTRRDELQVDPGLAAPELGEPGHQPAGREQRVGPDEQRRAAGVAPGDVGGRGGQGAQVLGDLLQVAGAGRGQADRARAVLEQRHAQPRLERLDLPADGPGGHVQFRRGLPDALQPARRLEEAKGVKRGQAACQLRRFHNRSFVTSVTKVNVLLSYRMIAPVLRHGVYAPFQLARGRKRGSALPSPVSWKVTSTGRPTARAPGSASTMLVISRGPSSSST